MYSLGQDFGQQVPEDSRRAKGWAGQLIEQHLGGTAGSKPVPDFELIGVELKTLPIDRSGSVLESTYVTTVPLADGADAEWHESVVRKKLARVLWVPLLAEKSMAVGERLVGSGFLWSPDASEELRLKEDWDDLMGKVLMGQVDEISGREGKVLQIRPKAANSFARTSGIGVDGQAVQVLPRGFYLRPSFTEEILQRHLLVRD
jgi:DNA mismatch repair protein MutH